MAVKLKLSWIVEEGVNEKAVADICLLNATNGKSYHSIALNWLFLPSANIICLITLLLSHVTIPIWWFGVITVQGMKWYILGVLVKQIILMKCQNALTIITIWEKNVAFFKIMWFDFVCVACLIRRIIVEYDMSIIQPVPILPTQSIENSTRAASFQDDIRTSTAYTVKPAYNDHLMGYFSAFWSSSRWPRAT